MKIDVIKTLGYLNKKKTEKKSIEKKYTKKSYLMFLIVFLVDLIYYNFSLIKPLII